MKKIFTILCLMALALGAQAAAPYKGIQLTFDKDGSGGNASPSNVAVVVKDMDGNAIDYVTATLTATNFNQFQTGTSAALGESTNFPLTPARGMGYGNAVGAIVEYTIKVENLSTEFKYNNAKLHIYTATGTGGAQGKTSDNAVNARDFDIDFKTGDTEAALATFASYDDADLNNTSESSGGLLHKVWTLNPTTTDVQEATTGTLYIKVTLTNDNKGLVGCFPGLAQVQLYDDTPETVTEYDAIRLTFNQDGTGNASPGNVTMSVKTLSGDLISGVSAELVETSFNQFQSGKVPSGTAATKEALTRANGFALIPRNDNAAGSGSNYANNNGATVVYTIKVSGLPSTFVYNTSGLDVYTTTANGTADQGTTQPKSFSFDVKTGNSTDDLADFASMGLTDIITASGTSVDGGLYHKLWNMQSTTSQSGNNPLYIRVTITKGTEGGCFVGLGAIELSTSINVTYKLMENNVEVKSVVVAQEKNSEVSVPTELTSGYYASAYTFPTSGTIGTEDCTITVTATPNTGVITDRDNLSNDKVYTLVTRRGALSTDGSAVTTNTAGDRPNFGIVKYVKDGEESYYLWSVNDSKWVKNDGTLTANVADIATNSKLVVTATDVRNNLKPLFFMGVGNSGLNTNAGGHCAVNNYTTRDDGNEFIITEAGDAASTAAYDALEAYFNPSATATYVISDANGVVYTSDPIPATIDETVTELPTSLQRNFCTYEVTPTTIATGNNTIPVTVTYSLPFTVSTSFSDAVWHYATIRTSKYLRADDNYKDGNGRFRTNSTNEETDAYQWAFFGNPYSNFYVMNKNQGNGKYLYAATVPEFQTVAEPTTTNESLWVPSVNGNGFSLRSVTGDNLYINDAGNGGNLGYWNSTLGATDEGSRWVTTLVPSDEEKFNQLITLLETYPFGTGVNQYKVVVEQQDYTSQMATIIEGLKTQGYSEANMANAQALLDGATLNMPQAGFYRVKGKTSNMMYLAAGLAANNKFKMMSEAKDSTIFYYSGTKLINYTTGMENGMNAGTWAWTLGGQGSVVTFEDGNTKGGYAIKSNNAYLHDSGDLTASADRGQTNNGGPRYNNWYLEPVTTLPITLKEVGGTFYATFSAPVDIASITGADAFNVKVSDDNKMASTKPIDGDGLKAGNGVVLIGTTNKATATIGAAAATATTNLKPQYASEPAATHNDAGHFFLGTKQNNQGTPVIGFYKLKSDGGKTGGFKAYIEKNPAQSSAPAVEGFMLVFDGGVTGIENMEHGAFDNGAVYNLQGQRVTKATKGVFIQNGKKVVLK